MTVLFCRNLDHHKLLQVASFLTSCAISFHFCSVNTLVIDTAGIDSSISVRLMHYAEVPIPTTLKQGAFGLCIKGNGPYPGDRNLLSFDLRIGRIGSLPSIPVQIRCSSVEKMISIPLNKSSIGRWIKSELSGFNITEVVCVDDEQVTDSFPQFRVPVEDESSYPRICSYKGKSFSVDHALPYAILLLACVLAPLMNSRFMNIGKKQQDLPLRRRNVMQTVSPRLKTALDRCNESWSCVSPLFRIAPLFRTLCTPNRPKCPGVSLLAVLMTRLQ